MTEHTHTEYHYPSMDNLSLSAITIHYPTSLTKVSGSVVSDSSLCSLSVTNSQSLQKLMSIELVMPSNHLILCRPFLLLPSVFPSIKVFSNESVLHIRLPNYWSFSFSISSSNEESGLISFRIDWFDLLSVQGLSRVFSNTTVHKCQFFSAQPSLGFPGVSVGKDNCLQCGRPGFNP